ncbi:unnamed protein product [Auanema sp. JU1783]|nr:unnamed protein product [Auanema sp. JU1783]
MEYFHKIRSTVTQVATQVSNALPGNPLSREYDIGEVIGTAGPGLNWKIFKAIKKSTKQTVSVWLYDKKDCEKWPKDDRELFLSTIKRGVSQLTRLRHPRLLVIEHPIEESRDSLAFATEPIFASLANCLGKTDNLGQPLPLHLRQFALLEIEIKHGLVQLGEALAFLHIDARILHRNLCPESVIINDRGAWKLGGFDFSVSGTAGPTGGMVYESFEWNERIPSLCQPNLDYFAPEYIMGGLVSPNADIFSLGALSFAVFNKCKSPMEHSNSIPKYKKNIEKVKSFPQQFSDNISPIFKDDFKMCLNYSPDLRPDATQFTKVAYFDDPLVKALNYFESLMQMDNNQKMQFFKSLPTVLSQFEKRPLLQKVMPWLAGECSTPDLIPFILPSIFHITEQATKEEFTASVLPMLIPVFSMERPYQIALLLLQRMELLLEKSHDNDIKTYILPLIYNSISSETTRIQELCLSIVPTIGKLVDRNSMKTQLLPKLLKLATEGGVLAIRVQALVCVGKLLPTLESWMVTEQVLPALPKISSKEPGLLMAILGIYKLSVETSSIGVGREQLAKSALPFLMATSVENTLNLHQFEQYMALIKTVLTKVETEQRSRLQQLSAGQEEQRGIPNFDEVLKASSSNILPQSLNDFGNLNLDVGSKKEAGTKTGALSLEEKKRLAAEQEMSNKKGNPVQPIPTMDTKVSMPSSKPTAASNMMFDPFDLSLSMTSSSNKGGAIDISEFMPELQNKNVASNNQNNFANFAINNSSSFPQQLNTFNANQSNSLGFPQPPRSTNAAVQRPSSQGNSLDALLAFPNKAKQSMGNSMNGFALPPPPTGTFQKTVAPQKPNTDNKDKDPFFDLLG